MKHCPKCKTDKPVDAFSKSSTRPDGRQGHCKSCRSLDRSNKREQYQDYEFQRRYGIGLAEYSEMLESQRGVCAICHEACITKGVLVVDHDHVTGKVRGLLCHRCNRGLGLYRDNTALLQSAINYLNRED